MMWSARHHSFVIEEYFKSGNSVITTQKLFRRRFHLAKVPDKKTILSWVKTFRTIGSALKTKPSGRRVMTPQNVDAQSQGVMEGRLDDAINILRNHAERPGKQPVPPTTTLNDISLVAAHSNGLIAAESYPGVAIISLDPHDVAGLTNLPDNVLRSRTAQPSSSSQITASLPFERNLNPKADCLRRREEKNEDLKLEMHTIPHPQTLDSLTHQRLDTLSLKYEADLKDAKAVKDTSSLASQLDDAKLMIAALEESTLLVMKKVTQLIETNNQFKKKIKELRCENLALSLKLRDAETFFGKESAPVLKDSTTKNKHNVEEIQFSAKSPASKEQKVSNVPLPKEESFKVQHDLLIAELKEKELTMLKLKEGCLKKDGVVEYLSKEKDNIQKASIALEVALKEAANIYKSQFLEIEKLKKKLEKNKSKKNSHCSETSSTKDEMPSSVNIKAPFSENSSSRDESSSQVNIRDEIMTEDARPSPSAPNRNRDSDTGEHVLGHSANMRKQSIDGRISPVIHRLLNFTENKEIERTHPDITVASSSAEPSVKCRESPDLQTMMDQNISNLSLLQSDELEGIFSLPCLIS